MCIVIEFDFSGFIWFFDSTAGEGLCSMSDSVSVGAEIEVAMVLTTAKPNPSLFPCSCHRS